MDKFEKIVEENNGYFVNGKVSTHLVFLNLFIINLKINRKCMSKH